MRFNVPCATVCVSFLAAAMMLHGVAAADAKSDSNKTTVTKEEAWQYLGRFVGRWEGTGKGRPGVSKITNTTEMILQGKYMCSVNKSVFEPQEGNPGGEVHEDWAIFSYDAGRKKIVMRQFDSEGFVNLFVMDYLSDDGKTLVMTSESSENAPPTLKARMTYTFVGDDEVHENFELAFDGKTFKPCVTTELKWQK